MKIVSFSLEQGNKYFGKIDNERFLIGSRVPFHGNKGLTNTTGTAAQKYDRKAFRGTHGFWADFIHPTSMAEGALFHTLNTYDRARFTFTFLQYAAQYGLDGKADRICVLVADIRHQGRAKSPIIAAALNAADPFKALLHIGQEQYPERIATLKREIEKLSADGTFGAKKYNLAKRDFVDA